MSMLSPTHHPSLRLLDDAEVAQEFEDLVENFGTYESLLSKAGAESLTPEERASLRRMENLRFLLKRTA